MARRVRSQAPAPVEIDRSLCSTCSIERAGDPPVIAPAPCPELNREPFPDKETQRLAAWQAVGMAQQILPEREACRASGRRLSWGVIPEAGGVHVCTDPYLVPYPNRGEHPGTRHIPSLLLVRILYGGQSKWQAGRWAMSSPFLSQISLTSRRPLGLHLSCSRLKCRDWSEPRTVPFATSFGQSLCASHRASTQQGHAPPSPPPGSRGPGNSPYPYRACDSAGPDTSGATRLLGGAVRPRSRLRSWGRVAVTSKARLSLSSVGTYLDRINRETGLTGEMPPSPKLVAVVCSRPQSPSSPP